MRKALLSISVIAAAGALVAVGGAFSVFNDTASSAAPFTNGTVKLSVTGQQPATDVLALTGPCTQSFTTTGNPVDAMNLGTVNNTGCSSTFTVHNSGSLPFELSGTSVADTNPVGLGCFTSTLTAADIAQTATVLPGADRILNVRTVTSGDDKGCQNVTDKVTVSLVAVESTVAKGNCVTWGDLGSPVGATGFCDSQPIDPTSATQAQSACETFYGATCYVEHADCAGPGFGPRPEGTWQNGELYFGYAAGCSGDAGRIWPISWSYGTAGRWAP